MKIVKITQRFADAIFIWDKTLEITDKIIKKVKYKKIPGKNLQQNVGIM